jgi:hypothetical protein
VTVDPAVFEYALLAQRGFGRVFCDWRPRTRSGEPTFDELDEYVAMVLADVHDDQRTPGAYRQVSAQYARQLVVSWLANNLTEGTPPVGGDADASVAQPFFGVFTEEPVFFTGTATKTLHDCDAGILVVDRSQIGLLWFADDE